MVDFRTSLRTQDPRRDAGTLLYPPGYVPAKVLAFVKNPVDKSVNAIVHCCEFQSSDDIMFRSTVLLDHWNKTYTVTKQKPLIVSPVLTVISLESILDRCFVVEESPGLKCKVNLDECLKQDGTKKRVHSFYENLNRSVKLVKHREFWGDSFIGS